MPSWPNLYRKTLTSMFAFLLYSHLTETTRADGRTRISTRYVLVFLVVNPISVHRRSSKSITMKSIINRKGKIAILKLPFKCFLMRNILTTILVSKLMSRHRMLWSIYNTISLSSESYGKKEIMKEVFHAIPSWLSLTLVTNLVTCH